MIEFDTSTSNAWLNFINVDRYKPFALQMKKYDISCPSIRHQPGDIYVIPYETKIYFESEEALVKFLIEFA